MKDPKFDEWKRQLEERYPKFQNGENSLTRDALVMHKNCIMYDNEILRLSRFNNPCRSCGIPLYTVNNFVIRELGSVCGLCYTMYTTGNPPRSPRPPGLLTEGFTGWPEVG